MDFNPEAFMQQQQSGELDTTFIPVPEGEYSAVAEGVNVRTTNTGKVILDVSWAVNDANVVEETGRENNTVRQSIFLDLTDAGTLDMGKGKNIGLGRLMEAVGIDMSKKWALQDVVGHMALVTVKHRMSDDGTVYADVKRVAAA